MNLQKPLNQDMHIAWILRQKPLRLENTYRTLNQLTNKQLMLTNRGLTKIVVSRNNSTTSSTCMKTWISSTDTYDEQMQEHSYVEDMEELN